MAYQNVRPPLLEINQACHDPSKLWLVKGLIVQLPHGRKGLAVGGGPFSENAYRELMSVRFETFDFR